MDFYVKLALLFLSITGSALMLFFTAQSLDSINETKDYVSEQNQSDAYAIRYASLSSFDADTVGKISLQEALTLIYNHATDHTPVVYKDASGNIYPFVTGKAGWIYNSHGKQVGQKLNYDGTVKPNPEFNTNIGVLNHPTVKVPAYEDLYRQLSNNYLNDKKFIVNIDPLNDGSLSLVVVIAVD